MRQIREASDYKEALHWQLTAKRVTFRYYGDLKQHRRPMIHRFEVKGGMPITSVIAENIMRSSPLLQRLQNR
jgi:hypothetical protein